MKCIAVYLTIVASQAETMLLRSAVGCFLVRVSERHFGYFVSIKSVERVMHFTVTVVGVIAESLSFRLMFIWCYSEIRCVHFCSFLYI